MKSSTANTSPWFIADTEDEVSVNSHSHYPFYSRLFCYGRRVDLRNHSSSVSSPRSGRFYDARDEDHQPHFLEACFLCRKPLGHNRDIFMYRDIPFCNEDCRQEQIEIDQAKERNWNLSSSVKALRKKDQNKSISTTKAQDYLSRTGTVAAA